MRRSTVCNQALKSQRGDRQRPRVWTTRPRPPRFVAVTFPGLTNSAYSIYRRLHGAP